jgi:hypothetical protein
MALDRTTDDDLLRRAARGHDAALQALVGRHLHPAWRLALVTAPTAGVARDAAVAGVVDGFAAALDDDRRPPVAPPLRVRVVSATRGAALSGTTTVVGDRGETAAAPSGAASSGLALDAFRALPERARTALWLVDVEGGTPAQAAPILGVEAGPASAMVARARDALRARLAADAAATAEGRRCARAMAKLPALAGGQLDAADRSRLQAHAERCTTCAEIVAVVAHPRHALRALIGPVPAGLDVAIAERWDAVVSEHRRVLLAPWSERTLGAVAAAVFMLGIAGAALVSGRDDTATQLAAPIDASGIGGGGAAAEEEEPIVEAPAPRPAVRPSVATTPPPADVGSSKPVTAAPAATGDERPSAVDAAPTPPAPRPAGDAPAPPPPPPPPDPAPEAASPASQVNVSVLGSDGVAVGLGDCTGANVLGTAIGCDPATGAPLDVTIETGGLLPPISLP